MVPVIQQTDLKWIDKKVFLTDFAIETAGSLSTEQGSAQTGMYAVTYAMIFNLISVQVEWGMISQSMTSVHANDAINLKRSC
jgi:hypothetical protein